MKKIIIAIDGFSGTGKSSTAKQVASALGYTYIDTGAMYRAMTFYYLENNLELSQMSSSSILDEIDLNLKGKSIFLNDRDVTTEIRTLRINERVSAISAIPEVRRKLVSLQQQIGKNGGIVMEGRDIGSVVFPEAELKVFMTADVKVRAERRRMEMAEQGMEVSLEEVIQNLTARDSKDSSRDDSPLLKLDDAIEVDTSDLTLSQQVEKILSLAKEIINED